MCMYMHRHMHLMIYLRSGAGVNRAQHARELCVCTADMWKHLAIIVAFLPIADAFAIVSRPAPFVAAPAPSYWAIASRAATISMQAPKIKPPPKDDDGMPSANPNEDTVVRISIRSGTCGYPQ